MDAATGYTIEEAAQRCGLTAHTLRYYEREGLLPPVAKADNGHRRYTDDDLGWVSMLRLLRATGMPIREMKDFMRLTWEGDHTIAARVEVLERVQTTLLDRMAADREHLRYLERKLDYYTGVLALEDATAADAQRAVDAPEAARASA